MEFKKTDSLFARIKEDLASYDNNNLIDEGKFYQYTKFIIDQLGLSVYREKKALIHVHNFKAQLPCDFSLLDSAFKCTPNTYPDEAEHFNGQRPFVSYVDQTAEAICEPNCEDCRIDCCHENKVLTKVTTRQYIKGVPMINNYTFPVLLRLGNRVSRDKCTKKCLNMFSDSPEEISIENKVIYTNFESDAIYMNYYAFPMDEETGLPMIPDVANIEMCIEYYIKYRLFENYWLNGDDPNIQNKLQYLQNKYNEMLGEAKTYVKTPSFATLTDLIRRNRQFYNIYQL